MCRVILWGGGGVWGGGNIIYKGGVGGGGGGAHVPMVQRSQYIRIKHPLHKHFAGMPMVGG